MALIPTGKFIFKSVGECKFLENYAIYAALQMPETNILKNLKCKKKKKRPLKSLFTHMESWNPDFYYEVFVC